MPETEPSASATPTLPAGEHPASLIDEFSAEMALVPEGIFLMGSDGESADAHEGPPHEVYTDAVYMDVYETTNDLYQACVEAGACQPPPLTSGYQDDPEFANYPAVNITWTMANEYCAWRGGRLPTEAEWEKAARWDPLTGSVRTYPWGDEPPDARYANTASADIGGTMPVGSYERGKSAVGLYDMAGNVWEWVSDSYAFGYYVDSPGINPSGPAEDTGQRVLRGGSFGDDDSYARTTARAGVGPEWAGASGVRCAREP